MLTLDHVYLLCGIYLVLFGVLSFGDSKNLKRFGTGLFWLVYGITFLGGSALGNENAGWMVILMAVIVAAKQMGHGDYHETSKEEKNASAQQLGNRLLIPVLAVGVITLILAATTKLGALVSFGIASIVAIVIALAITRGAPLQTFHEGRRLIDAIGWAAILSQLLAALGSLFAKAGIGKIVSDIVASAIPTDSALAVVIAYCLGMAIFTIIMGNAFAAFAVITSGIGIPLVIVAHGANPLIVAPIAMLAGYCGTLMTPMAANFNIVPAALLEMQSKYGVIRAQIPLAISLLAANILLMYFLGFHG
ncbi:DUF979 domain-containing protein [Selenomonas sp. oral taxon 138]|uniref:DUF979 domain-containing protein n=1 Tax=Selenomonas sp. oral taxon 138 TaxID=712532 RepID=UPI0002A392C2|nr:DUF979 domain-containing protein [Selenomonas sp. oral taxon 138]EKX95638.1 hypothetical protein HMPREF9163_02119 [Selenomonas sp. oral taxon 138 str. F0429]